MKNIIFKISVGLLILLSLCRFVLIAFPIALIAFIFGYNDIAETSGSIGLIYVCSYIAIGLILVMCSE